MEWWKIVYFASLGACGILAIVCVVFILYYVYKK